MRSDIRNAKDISADLKHVAHQIKKSHKSSKSEVNSARNMMNATSKAMDVLKTTARNYDEKNGRSTGVKGAIKNAIGKNDNDPVDNLGGGVLGSPDTVEALVKATIKDNFNMNVLSYQITAAEKSLSSPSIVDRAKEVVHEVKDKLKGDKSSPIHNDHHVNHAMDPRAGSERWQVAHHAHSLLNGNGRVVRQNPLEQVGSRQHVVQSALSVGNGEAHLAHRQLLLRVGQHLDRGGVHVVHVERVQHDTARGDPQRLQADHLALDELSHTLTVGEVQRTLDTDGDDVAQVVRLREVLAVDEAAVVQLAEDGNGLQLGLPHECQDGADDRSDQAVEHTETQREHERGRPHEELVALDTVQPLSLAEFNQRPASHDNDRRQRCARQVVERARQRVQGQHHDEARDNRRQLRVGVLQVHGRAGHTAGRRHGLEEAAHDAGNADARQLLLRVDVLATLNRETLGHSDARQEHHHRHGECMVQDGAEAVAVDQVRGEAVPRHLGLREAARDVARQLKVRRAQRVADNAAEDADNQRTQVTQRAHEEDGHQGALGLGLLHCETVLAGVRQGLALLLRGGLRVVGRVLLIREREPVARTPLRQEALLLLGLALLLDGRGVALEQLHEHGRREEALLDDLDREEVDDGDGGHGEGVEVGVADVLEDLVHRRGRVVLRLELDAQGVGDLREHDEQAAGRDEAAHDRAREEVGDLAQVQDAHQQQDAAAEEGHHDARGHALVLVLDVLERGAHEQRHLGAAGHGQHRAEAEDGVDQRRRGGRVQAVVRRHVHDGGERHLLRDEHHGHRDAGHDVELEVALHAVVGQPAEDRRVVLHLLAPRGLGQRVAVAHAARLHPGQRAEPRHVFSIRWEGRRLRGARQKAE
ncbi:hypothetical protein ON010_g16308 [Phytophthora cinnamomi]|nr:hypothetical protein ON010_g16308 [Phytophthora cinnamomi]